MSELQDLLSRLWADLLARPSGPFAFRLILQPLMAVIFAVRDGTRDARTQRSPYFWTLLHVPEQRRGRLAEGVQATLKVVLLGVVIDSVFQFKVLGSFYPGEALGFALLLGFIPYLLIRGPVDRVARRLSTGKSRRGALAAEPLARDAKGDGNEQIG
jgi:hypothetical protein